MSRPTSNVIDLDCSWSIKWCLSICRKSGFTFTFTEKFSAKTKEAPITTAVGISRYQNLSVYHTQIKVGMKHTLKTLCSKCYILIPVTSNRILAQAYSDPESPMTQNILNKKTIYYKLTLYFCDAMGYVPLSLPFGRGLFNTVWFRGFLFFLSLLSLFSLSLALNGTSFLNDFLQFSRRQVSEALLYFSRHYFKCSLMAQWISQSLSSI